MNRLNEEQLQAVRSEDNTIIIAGPGTGKTRTLTQRIGYLLQKKNVDPKDIVALTFTKKAAAEMRERVEELLNSSRHSDEIPATEESHKKDADAQLDKHNEILRLEASAQNDDVVPLLKLRAAEEIPFIGTFHSLAYEILKKHDIEPKIASEKELAEIMRKICGNYPDICSKYGKSNLPTQISLFRSGSQDNFPPGFMDLVGEYDQQLEASELIDYDDLLIKAKELAIKKKIKYRHVLVDEFQDTNLLQYKLLKSLLTEDGRIFVIGDPYQSIYAFRGSKPELIKKFQHDYPNVNTIFLNKNYRSANCIVDFSNSIFDQKINLKSVSEAEGAVKIVETYNQYSEAEWIISQINERVGGLDLNYANDIEPQDKDYSFADFAVIYRVHSLNRVLEKKFYQSGVPFQVVGGGSLYEQKVIKFIIMSLQYIASDYYQDQGVFHYDKKEILDQICEIEVVDHPMTLIEDLLIKLNHDTNLQHLVEEIIEKFSLIKNIEKDPIKQLNLKEFIGSLVRFNTKKDGLKNFLGYINYLEKHEYYDERADCVTLMTMHASKGLEFPFVFITGFEQGIIPYQKSLDEEKVEEEMRLFYVSLTRAETEIQLIHTQKRYGKDVKISEFINILDEKIPEIITDPAISRIKRKIARSKKKQLDLF